MSDASESREQRTVKETPRESEKRFRLLLENMEDMVSRHLPDSTIIYVSPSCRPMLGYAPEELVNTRAADYVHPDDVLATLATIDEAIAEHGGHYRVQHRMKRKNGGYVWVETTGRLLYGTDGRLLEIQCVVRDITARKRAEKDLLAWKNRYESAVKSSGQVLYDWDSATNQLTYGGAIEHLLGYSAEEISGDLSRWVELIHPDDRELFTETIGHLVAVKESMRFEYRVRRKDGSYILIEEAGQFIQESHGKVTQVIGFVKDITQRKQVEEVIEKRIVALTKPLDDAGSIVLEDLFSLDDLQRLQDEFARATGVASIITHTDGTPITAPSNFCRLCVDVIRKTDKGRANCFKSDAALGRFNPDGPIIQPCMSGGLWDAGAAISVGGKHIANWLVGQVRDETQTEEKLRRYAREIEADEEAAAEAFHQVPAMSRQQFENVAQSLFTLARQLSTTAYQNVQQARFIADCKRAEKALLTEKRLSDEYINSLPGLFYVFDEQRFVRRNREWERVTGYSAEEVDAMYGTDFFEGEDRTLIAERMGKVFREGASEAEAELVTKDGRRIPYYFTGLRKVFDGKDHLVGLGIDITDRKRAQREREELIGKLEAQNAELERFTYTVSHDLKSPLITIKGYVGMLRQDLPQADSGPVAEDLARISDAADKMDQLLRDLLELSRIGRLANPPVEVSLEELANEARDLVHGQAKEAGVRVEIGPGLPTVQGDRVRLLEVLQNLIDNAVKYMGDQSRPRIEIGARRDGNQTVCYVRDNGIGIETRYHEKVFGLFDQLDQSVDGSGIGLALARRIIEIHGGRIWVESQGPGRGSTFCFTIAAKA